MQFFLVDFTLAVAVLLGYRALIALRRAPAVRFGNRATPYRQSGSTRSSGLSRPRRAVQPKAVARKPVAPTRAPGSQLPRVSIHRLINFW